MINKQFDKLILIQEKFNDFVYYYSYIFNIYEKSLNIIHQINMCIKLDRRVMHLSIFKNI